MDGIRREVVKKRVLTVALLLQVKEIFWWKHAAACHQGSTILGEGDVFVDA